MNSIVRQIDTWTKEALGRLFEPTTVRAKDTQIDRNNIPVLSMTRAYGLIQQSDKFDKRVASRDVTQYKVVNRGDLVYGFPIDEGVIAILHRFPKGLVSPAYHVLKPIKEFDQRYIDELLRTPELLSTYTALSSNVVERRRNLAVRDFLKIEISLPPIEEQGRIATVLGLVRRALQLEEQLIEVTTDLKKSLMRKLLCEGLEGEPRKRTKLGLIPKSWEVVKLGEVCKLSTGTTPATDRNEYYEGDTPFVKTAEIANNRISAASAFVSQLAIEDYGLKIHPAGTVLMAMYGQGKTRGQVGILHIAAATTQNAAAIHPSEEIDAEFLWQSLMARYDDLRESGALGQISHLNLGYLRNFLILKPPLQVQRNIAQILGYVDEHSTLVSVKKETLRELLNSLNYQLLTGRTRLVDLELSRVEPVAA